MTNSPDTAAAPAAAETTSAPADLPAGIIGRIYLQRPVKPFGEERTFVDFKEPSARDIMSCGMPCTLDQGHNPPRVVFDPGAMTNMIAVLSGMPVPTVQEMHPKDWTNCAWELARFFVPGL